MPLYAVGNWFDLDLIARSGQVFLWDARADKSFLLRAMGRTLIIRESAPGFVRADCGAEEWKSVWRKYFDLDWDYEGAVSRIDPADGYLLRAAENSRGIRILRQDLWETLISFIVSQNNNIPRIRSILLRLAGEGESLPRPEKLLRMEESALRAMGLGYRAAYLRPAAEKFLEAGWPEALCALPFQAARAELMRLKGVGPKVADCVLLFALGHKEAFPVDTWIRKVELERYGGRFPVERYPDCAGVMQQFLFFSRREAGA